MNPYVKCYTSYNAVKKNPTAVSDLFITHKKQHSKKYYYRVQKRNDSNDPTSITARFLYLNKYSFMGMYRVNKSGKLCLSFSSKKYNSANIDKKLQQCSSFLSDASIYVTDFSFIEPKENDFVYFDPPYYQAGERFYTRLPFDKNEQIRLRNFVRELTNKGVKLMISNSNTDFIRELYQDFTINTVNTKYALTGQKEITRELVITNYVR
ncbi:DNA adenine methylase [Candidatus Tisiphia endosymbiont of Oplodontha viridula]|uniref:DNA adenine methylase n=1 Tax=Candidatus Tisiphia endosymbiont of Oplodontha viridula TaxID=3077925 RepID=UPI0035C8F330